MQSGIHPPVDPSLARLVAPTSASEAIPPGARELVRRETLLKRCKKLCGLLNRLLTSQLGNLGGQLYCSQLWSKRCSQLFSLPRIQLVFFQIRKDGIAQSKPSHLAVL